MQWEWKTLMPHCTIHPTSTGDEEDKIRGQIMSQMENRISVCSYSRQRCHYRLLQTERERAGVTGRSRNASQDQLSLHLISKLKWRIKRPESLKRTLSLSASQETYFGRDSDALSWPAAATNTKLKLRGGACTQCSQTDPKVCSDGPYELTQHRGRLIRFAQSGAEIWKITFQKWSNSVWGRTADKQTSGLKDTV